jgi:hypothetical protein
MTSPLRTAIVATFIALWGAAALAQTPAAATQEVMQRQANQQQRIESGLKDGSLTTGEAARLEKGEASVGREISRDLKKGPLTAAEQRQINRRENALSRDIHAARSNAQTGDPSSASSRRMQADVQRNANQAQRMANGVKDGQLTGREAARLERGQAHVNQMEVKAGRDGHVSAAEQRHVQRTEDRQSQRIHRVRAE